MNNEGTQAVGYRVCGLNSGSGRNLFFPLKPRLDQYIAIHANLTAREFFLVYFYLSGPFTCIFSKTSPDFSCVGCGLNMVPM